MILSTHSVGRVCIFSGDLTHGSKMLLVPECREGAKRRRPSGPVQKMKLPVSSSALRQPSKSKRRSRRKNVNHYRDIVSIQNRVFCPVYLKGDSAIF